MVKQSLIRGPAGEPSNRIIVIGGGPTGLTAAYELARRGIETVVLEKHHIVGGLARTERFRDNHFDLGGHRFYTQMPEIERLWREILGDDLLRRPRLSRILLDGDNHNLWQINREEEYLEQVRVEEGALRANKQHC